MRVIGMWLGRGGRIGEGYRYFGLEGFGSGRVWRGGGFEAGVPRVLSTASCASGFWIQ